ncbi:MAG: DNA-3-methyladenine glycosylase family protein [Gemmataceae bacterium]
MSKRPGNPHSLAQRHLQRNDPVLKALITAVGNCTLQPGGDPFSILVRSILSQMISTRAAEAISLRVETACEGRITPNAILGLGEAQLKDQGLSMAKVRAIRDLADRATDGRLPLTHLDAWQDDEIIAALTEVRGIGVWTAEMFLIFGLGRPDVLPVGDYGLRAGVKEQYGLEDLPRPGQLRAIAEPWAPHRSIATWYIWRSRGGVPQSE